MIVMKAQPVIDHKARELGVHDRALGNNRGRQCLDAVFPLQQLQEAAADLSTEGTVIPADVLAYFDFIEPVRVAICLLTWGLAWAVVAGVGCCGSNGPHPPLSVYHAQRDG